MSLLTILIFAAVVKAVIDRRSQATPVGIHEHLGRVKPEKLNAE
jgi:hypothetical protein